MALFWITGHNGIEVTQRENGLPKVAATTPVYGEIVVCRDKWLLAILW